MNDFAQTPLQKKNQFQPPECELGQSVLFFRNPGAWDRFTFGHIVRTGAKTLDIFTIEGQLYTQVRHRDDPRCQDPSISEFGAWDFSPNQKMLNALFQKIDGDMDDQYAVFKESLESIKQQEGWLRQEVHRQSEAITNLQEMATAVEAMKGRMLKMDQAIVDLSNELMVVKSAKQEAQTGPEPKSQSTKRGKTGSSSNEG